MTLEMLSISTVGLKTPHSPSTSWAAWRLLSHSWSSGVVFRDLAGPAPSSGLALVPSAWKVGLISARLLPRFLQGGLPRPQSSPPPHSESPSLASFFLKSFHLLQYGIRRFILSLPPEGRLPWAWIFVNFIHCLFLAPRKVPGTKLVPNKRWLKDYYYYKDV